MACWIAGISSWPNVRWNLNVILNDQSTHRVRLSATQPLGVRKTHRETGPTQKVEAKRRPGCLLWLPLGRIRWLFVFFPSLPRWDSFTSGIWRFVDAPRRQNFWQRHCVGIWTIKFDILRKSHTIFTFKIKALFIDVSYKRGKFFVEMYFIREKIIKEYKCQIIIAPLPTIFIEFGSSFT